MKIILSIVTILISYNVLAIEATEVAKSEFKKYTKENLKSVGVIAKAMATTSDDVCSLYSFYAVAS